jgi:hypothetical protein
LFGRVPFLVFRCVLGIAKPDIQKYGLAAILFPVSGFGSWEDEK